MLRFLIPHLLTALILFFISLGIYLGNGSDACDKHGAFIVRLPKVCLIVGALDAVGFGILLMLMYLFPNNTANLWVYCGFSVFILLGCYLMYSTIAWRIIYSDEMAFFQYRSILFQYKTIRYDECYFQFEKDKLVLEYGEKAKKIHIPKISYGYDRFATIIRQRAKRKRTT